MNAATHHPPAGACLVGAAIVAVGLALATGRPCSIVPVAADELLTLLRAVRPVRAA